MYVCKIRGFTKPFNLQGREVPSTEGDQSSVELSVDSRLVGVKKM